VLVAGLSVVFSVLLCACAVSSNGAAPGSSVVGQPLDGKATFAYTGTKQSFKVPAGVTQVTIAASGASGAAGYGFGYNKYGAPGGLGGRVKATIPVTSGERLAISGSLTQLSGPEGIPVDASGYAYVANWEASSLVVFEPGANGDEAPAREDSSGLYGPNGVAVDARGRTYLSNGCQDNEGFVAVYAEGANDAGPLRIIEGGKTKLDDCATSIVVR
jgi:hypothetical protein